MASSPNSKAPLRCFAKVQIDSRWVHLLIRLRKEEMPPLITEMQKDLSNNGIIYTKQIQNVLLRIVCFRKNLYLLINSRNTAVRSAYHKKYNTPFFFYQSAIFVTSFLLFWWSFSSLRSHKHLKCFLLPMLHREPFVVLSSPSSRYSFFQEYVSLATYFYRKWPKSRRPINRTPPNVIFNTGRDLFPIHGCSSTPSWKMPPILMETNHDFEDVLLECNWIVDGKMTSPIFAMFWPFHVFYEASIRN